MIEMTWKCDDFLLFSAGISCNFSVFQFWTVDQTNKKSIDDALNSWKLSLALLIEFNSILLKGNNLQNISNQIFHNLQLI